MMSLLTWIEQTGFATWVRESGSVWSYPMILFLHTVGLGILVGINAAIDMRVLGLARKLPLAPMERLFPFMWAGFWINAVSGTALLMADATTKLTNPVFYVKMGFIAVSVILIKLLRSRVIRNAAGFEATKIPIPARWMAAASLACWAGAITAGRLMAYIGPVSGIPGLRNHL